MRVRRAADWTKGIANEIRDKLIEEKGDDVEIIVSSDIGESGGTVCPDPDEVQTWGRLEVVLTRDDDGALGLGLGESSGATNSGSGAGDGAAERRAPGVAACVAMWWTR